MGDAPTSLPPPPPPPPSTSPTPSTSPPRPPIMPMLYYSVIIFATVAGLLALYNLIIFKCGALAADRRFPSSAGILSRRSISTFKHKTAAAAGGSECAVCLSAFEDGEELKRLPNCTHTFHAPCIDMWLYSHSDCPLCRTVVAPPRSVPGILV